MSVVDYKVAILTNEHEFYKLALPIVRDYINDPKGINGWEVYYRRIHAAVLQSKTGHTVPHSMRNRFCEAIIEHYRKEATEMKYVYDEYDVVCGNCGARRGAHFTDAAGAIRCRNQSTSSTFIATQSLRGKHETVAETHTLTQPEAAHNTPTKEEDNMSAIKVETFTFVNNTRFNQVTDNSCYMYIKQSEQQIEKLSSMKTQPISAKNTIKELEDGVVALVELMNARTAEKK